MTASLHKREVFSYALPSLGLSAIGMTFFVYFPKFYIDHVQLSATWFGTVLVLTRLLDAFIDPWVGRMSDLYASHRKLWLVCSSVLVSVFFFLLCSPHLAEGILSAEYFFLIGVVFFFFLWSSFSVPYQALGLSLTDDYHERTRVLGFRETAVLLGTILAASLPAAYELVMGGGNDFGYLSFIALLYSSFLILGAISIFATLEPLSLRPSAHPLSSAFREVLKLQPFTLLLCVYILTSFGSTLSGAIIFFYIEHVLQSSNAPLYIFLYFLSSFLFAPIWISWSRRVGKKEAWIHALLVCEIAFVGILFLGSGDELWYLALILLSSIGLGGALILPASLQADVAQYDASLHDVSREAVLVGYWSFGKKLSAAIAAGIAFPILDWFGYIPGQEQVPEVASVIRLLYCLVPALCYLAAIYCASKYELRIEKEMAC